MQRTRAEQVAPVYEAVAQKYPEPKFMAREKPADLLAVVGTLGLHWRVPLMVEMARAIEGQGQPPDDYEQLLELPGVGPYAAAAYLSMHRDQRASIVDSNVVRLLGRVFGFEHDGETRRKQWLIDLADSLTPRQNYRDYNFAILDLAMTVCRPKPLCGECPLAGRDCSHAGAASRPRRRIRTGDRAPSGR